MMLFTTMPVVACWEIFLSLKYLSTLWRNTEKNSFPLLLTNLMGCIDFIEPKDSHYILKNTFSENNSFGITTVTLSMINVISCLQPCVFEFGIHINYK